MEMCNEDKSNDDAQEPSLADKFSKLFSELEDCNEEEQKQKIEGMNRLIEEMNIEELKSIINEEIFNKMNKMIEEKKMSMENAILLLKHVGYCNVLKNVWNLCFDSSSLGERFKKMIIDEEKKEEKNEKLFSDLCECFVFLNGCINSKMLCVCVPCLLKVASVKEESEENQTEVEMALLALSNISFYTEIEKEAYLKKITEIIEHQQNHRNLTKLAYQSAWEFLIKRFIKDRNLEDMIVNELHFGREAARELEELTRNVDWNRKKGEEGGKEAKEEFALVRWLQTFSIYFQICRLKNEENVGLLKNIVQVHRAEKDYYSVISNLCIYSLRSAAERRVVKVEDLLKGGAVDAVLEELNRPTLNKDIMNNGLQFLVNVSNRLKEKTDNEMEEEERKAMKRKMFEKMEEEGYEDIIISFHENSDFLLHNYNHDLSLNISDYFVNV
ncbi:uncharacterized protein MONOS_16270 [Monocercomonoides exilis]|uniref:uncharacterized protein n=1 Tax=Monocercomonoides exilis TaxID=2049356 RepID=UPI00355943E9|nr:hypothetical protein MONOS_16270 [Monocercomonoides exilis]|eukprot:MONOS_16270.1-p1 / transcript=MONOS_16270.1 / gene=MONOS_16270 / organism=Monocercomonoides_exilis_PA203 / gene_product=unspecified product / transcript_product=unspecified product / location=Mono_scaffold01603:3750-5200(-) / protein_length=442 / sequence_SO=supercontig / SO=protein_coding / is_pseudo=false